MRRLYDSLIRNDAVLPVDLIFVMAGRIDRKQYGLELFRSGIAPRLVLSVGRFEVSKLSMLRLDWLNDLIGLRDQTPPDERHFFVTLGVAGARIEKANLPRWNTYGEILGLRRFLEREPTRRIMIVSTDIHLNRVSVAVEKLCQGMGVEFRFCPVPETPTSPSRQNWWHRANDRRFVGSELLKLVGYRIIVSMPRAVSSRLMRLK
jgi:hypothetical protein